jgi:hypothetical protein
VSVSVGDGASSDDEPVSEAHPIPRMAKTTSTAIDDGRGRVIALEEVCAYGRVWVGSRALDASGNGGGTGALLIRAGS